MIFMYKVSNNLLTANLLSHFKKVNESHDHNTRMNKNNFNIRQSFQVEGPQNREISLFIGNTIGRFFTETCQGGKTVSNSCYHVLQH